MSKLEIVVDNTKHATLSELPVILACNRCHHEWTAALTDIVSEVRCPMCSKDAS